MQSPTDPQKPADELPLQALGRAASAVSGIFLGAVVILVLIGVVARYVVSMSLPWAEEVARMMLVWLTFGGAAAATFRMTHIRVDTIYGRFPEGRVRVILEITAIVLTIVALVVLIWASRGLLFGPSAGAINPGSGIEARWTRIALPIASVVMIAFLIAQLRYVIKHRRMPVPPSEGPRDEV
jgi:TRAP-type C4-dicarboxylate transport system permease small subunit